MLQLSDRDAPVWVDNLQVFEADAVRTKPDEAIRFEHNASAAIKVIALDRAYVDAKGQRHSGSLSLAPYDSIVLVRDPRP